MRPRRTVLISSVSVASARPSVGAGDEANRKRSGGAAERAASRRRAKAKRNERSECSAERAERAD